VATGALKSWFELLKGDTTMARKKNLASRKITVALRRAGVKLQTAFMQTKPTRADGRPHGVMPKKRRGHGWTSKNKSKS
jgi:hypothetical protein